MNLRPYQSEALEALERGWTRGALRLGVALPTGTGKTHVMAELAARYALSRVLVLVHRDTLVEQTERRFREHVATMERTTAVRIAPGHVPGRITVGVVKAARNVVSADVVVASVHTLRNDARLLQLAEPSLIIVDEAHVSMSDTYARIFDRWPKARVAGFTATWTRSDSRKLGDFWEEIVYERNIRWAIREGHLVPPRGLSIGAPEGILDDVRVSRTTGDFNEKDLAEAVTVDEIRDNVVRGYTEHAAGRSAVLFAPTQAAAEFFRAGLAASGVPTGGIYATTGPRDRRRIFDAYRRRQVAVLTTCTALAEGWDAPWCSCALMVRPTRHAGLYIQQVGRVLRPWPGKTDALVLDFVAGANTLDLRAALEVTDDRRTCPRCGNVFELIDGRWRCPDPECRPEESDDGWTGPAGEEATFVVGRGTKPVDLFAGTDVVWLTTDLGVPFVATSTALYFLCEVDGSWSVGTCRPESLTGGRWLAEGMDAQGALNYASIVAVDDDPTLAARDASWRRAPRPSDAQVRYCRSIGLPVLPDDTKSTLSNRITQRRASATLAPIGMR